MNNRELYIKLKGLIKDGLKVVNAPCETQLIKISEKISNLIFNKEEWAGNEMLGKLIIQLVDDIIDNKEGGK
uniref:Uncharacterized protein n=1 Tax=viral metagenome TaxID=1070528 RepID=A0A6M3M7D8_9ZZZZ